MFLTRCLRYPLLLAYFWQCHLVSAQAACDTTACSKYCKQADKVFSGCDKDSTAFDSKALCYCASGHGLGLNFGMLEDCVACDRDGLGARSLSFYQEYTLVCFDYFSGDGASAQQLLNGPPSDAVAQFSSTLLPIIQSNICSPSGSAATGTTAAAASTTAPTVSTGTMTGDASNTAAATVTSGGESTSPTTSHASSTNTTPNSSSVAPSSSSSTSASASSSNTPSQIMLVLWALLGLLAT